mmetsp:Transcript_40600/g.79489  ORF Transcript_40600/g.79489 Transcript_40600/m.79489 type:complete len:446 (-) Transcript_40600:1203-2540(-)
MPHLRSGLAARPFLTAILISCPTPSVSSTWKGSFGRIPSVRNVGRKVPTSSREKPYVICVRSLVPNEKKSATFAISPAISAALGISIMVPTRKLTRSPCSRNTSSATRRTRLLWCSSSLTDPTRGTMMSGTGVWPAFLTARAASMMARACISEISGCTIPRRHPRSPSMGFTSDSLAIFSVTAPTDMPSSVAIILHTSFISPLGKNSWRGGSSRRMVTVHPSIALKIPSKSERWKGRSLESAFFRCSTVSAMTISRTAISRSSDAKNMCSVRTSPMPSAPFLLASAASSGVSALVKTLTLRLSSTHPMKVPRSPEMVGGASASLPSMTSPVLPLSESQSPVWYVFPPSSMVLALSLTLSSWQPDTQVLPQPRATTAACEVMPPLLVRMPSAACIPLTSSGLVSARTRIAAPPCALKASASSGVKTICPTAAPGEAGSPLPITRSL